MSISKFVKYIPAILVFAFAVPVNVAIAKPANISAATSSQTEETAYDYQMRNGYAAAQSKDYATALIHFRDALYVRPYDRNALIAYYNMLDILDGNPQKDNKVEADETDFERYMRIGYAATNNKDFQTALINFERALKLRPNNQYATQAIRNVRTYINSGS